MSEEIEAEIPGEVPAGIARPLAEFMGCSEKVAFLLLAGKGMEALRTYEQEAGGLKDYEWMIMITSCSQGRRKPQ